MKIFEYDICDGDKGVILAESYEEAVKLFREEYSNVDLDTYEPSEIDESKYEYGGLINELCDYDGKQKLVCIIS